MGVVGADEAALYNAIRRASSRKGTDGDDVIDGASVGCDEDSRLFRGSDKQLDRVASCAAQRAVVGALRCTPVAVMAGG